MLLNNLSQNKTKTPNNIYCRFLCAAKYDKSLNTCSSTGKFNKKAWCGNQKSLPKLHKLRHFETLIQEDFISQHALLRLVERRSGHYPMWYCLVEA